MTGSQMTRRSWLGAVAATGLSAGVSQSLLAENAHPASGLGLVIYCCSRQRALRQKEKPSLDLFHPSEFLSHCREVGAGGMQVNVSGLQAEEQLQLTHLLEKHGLFLEAIISAPKKESDVSDFEEELRIAKNIGAKAVRTTIIPGRRYEQFESLDQFRAAQAVAARSAQWMARVAEKHRLPVAIENHKDHRNEERLALFESIGSEYLGACLDTGNSMALLEDPLETVRAFAPWAHAVHLKDQAVQPHPEGFLLADIPLGQGCLDLKQMVAIIREAKPNMRFCLELITRDPLLVPVFETRYWRTFPDLPATDLAQTMRLVRGHSTEDLQQVSSLSPMQQAVLEENNVRISLDYARDELGITR